MAYVPDDELEAYTEAFERAGIEVPVQPSGKNAVVVENNGFAEEDFEFDPATGTITSYNGFATYLAIPETIGGAPVKAIGPEAFAQPLLSGAVWSCPRDWKPSATARSTTAKRWAASSFPSTLKTIGEQRVLQRL